MERLQSLINFSRDEILKFKTGNIPRISTLEELRIRFALRRGNVIAALRETGLTREREALKQECRAKNILPSKEFAWLLGLLAGGGSISLSNGAIRFTEDDEPLLKYYKDLGEKVFRLNGSERIFGIQKNGIPRKQVLFNSRETAKFLGNLSRTNWPQTVKDKHSWVFDDLSYLWGFLEGLFEARGSVNPDGKRILIHTSFPEVANFIIDILARVEIHHPRIYQYRNVKRGMREIEIFDTTELKILSKNIHSKIPEKESRLEKVRNYPLEASKRIKTTSD